MDFGEDIKQFLLKSAKRALAGNTPASLRKASIEIIEKQVHWLCVLDDSATEDDVEDCSAAGAEIIADFTSEYGFKEMFEKIKSIENPRTLINVVYERVEYSGSKF